MECLRTPDARFSDLARLPFRGGCAVDAFLTRAFRAQSGRRSPHGGSCYGACVATVIVRLPSARVRPIFNIGPPLSATHFRTRSLLCKVG